MADDESHPHSTEPPPGPSAGERRDHEILATERFQFAKLTQIVRLADFMALLMVLATFFSAYATWRTSQVTSLIFAIANRPYLGVQQVTFEAVDTQRPTIVINFRNFGSIPALDAIVSVHAVVDGKTAKEPTESCRPPTPAFSLRRCRISCTLFFHPKGIATSFRANRICKCTSGCCIRVPST